MGHQVITVGPADAGMLGQVVADAFHDLPPSPWLIPDPANRRRIFPVYFRLHVEHALAAGLVHTTPDRTAVALWLPVASNGPGPPGDGYTARLAEVTGPWTDRFTTFEAALDRHHPTGTVHHYLAMLAVRPHAQGQGIGTALLHAHHSTLDQTGISAYLETPTERHRAFYTRHGYAEHGPPFYLPDATVMTRMWRPSALPAPAPGG